MIDLIESTDNVNRKRENIMGKLTKFGWSWWIYTIGPGFGRMDAWMAGSHKVAI